MQMRGIKGGGGEEPNRQNKTRLEVLDHMNLRCKWKQDVQDLIIRLYVFECVWVCLLYCNGDKKKCS